PLASSNFIYNALLLMSSALSTIVDNKSSGWMGNGIDVLIVFGTIFGIATSFGLGATQITAGLSYSFDGIENNILTQTIIILIITVAFVVSATTGVNKGIRYLSMGNVVIAIALMVFVF